MYSMVTITNNYTWASLVAKLVKKLPIVWEDPCSIPGLGRSPGVGNGYASQYSWDFPGGSDSKEHGEGKTSYILASC